MKDTIYREDAIKAIEELPNAYNGWSDAYDKTYIIGTLEEVPKADRPQGEWIEHHKPFTWMGFAYWTCSECGYGENNQNWIQSNFCPNCGADMRKGADDGQRTSGKREEQTMSRYIDAEILKERLIKNITLTNAIDRSFNEAPSIDIVRCGECKHWTNGDDTYGICYRCANTRQMKADDFCSYGEREGE